MKIFSFLKKRATEIKEDVGMNNVINSIFNSKPIYDKLKVKCHPDLFIDDDLKKQAEFLFQKLQTSKHDIQAMKDLEFEINALYKHRKL